MDEFEFWRLPDGISFREEEILGYAVRVADGPVGTVIKSSGEAGRSYLVLAARPWLDSTMVMLPSALIVEIDHERRIIRIASERAAIRAAPPFAADRFRDCAYRAELGFHYARSARSWPPSPAAR